MNKAFLLGAVAVVVYLYTEQRAENQRLWMVINGLKRELHPLEEIDFDEQMAD